MDVNCVLRLVPSPLTNAIMASAIGGIHLKAAAYLSLATQVHPERLSNDAANPSLQIGFAMISQKPNRTAISAMLNHSRGFMLCPGFGQA